MNPHCLEAGAVGTARQWIPSSGLSTKRAVPAVPVRRLFEQFPKQIEVGPMVSLFWEL